MTAFILLVYLQWFMYQSRVWSSVRITTTTNHTESRLLSSSINFDSCLHNYSSSNLAILYIYIYIDPIYVIYLLSHISILIYTYIYIYIQIYVYICLCICACIYVYVYKIQLRWTQLYNDFIWHFFYLIENRNLNCSAAPVFIKYIYNSTDFSNKKILWAVVFYEKENKCYQWNEEFPKLSKSFSSLSSKINPD